MDPYGPCPCGSGKAFKWCCKPIHVELTKAFEQDAAGQHDTALKLMDDIVAQHADNPEVWGRKAQLLYQNDKPDEAEKALDKAIEISPKYPFGYYLRGRFRHAEGEIAGALNLFRKAADLYDPAAAPILSQIHALIGDCELKLNHPVAARAALLIARRFEPGETEISKGLEQLFGDKARLPLSARKDYAYLAASAGETNLEAIATGKLSDAAADFEKRIAAGQDAAAWYNLGVTRAWLGENAKAIEALDHYVELEPDAARAEAAWSLAEVLRCGQGLEDQADCVEHSFFAPVGNPQKFFEALNSLEKDRLLLGAQVREEEGLLTALVLDRPPALTAESAANQTCTLGAYLLLAGDLLRLWNTNKEALDKVVEEVSKRAAGALGDAHRARGPAQFADVLAEAMAFPTGATTQEEVNSRVEEHVQTFFEEKWIHRQLKSLGGVAPIDVAGHKTLTKKLSGLMRFLEECAALSQFPYDFTRLRRKLGLVAGEAAPTATSPASVDIAALGAPELAGLAAESLSDEQAELAFQTALKLDARELAGRFAKNLVARPVKTDRFAVYRHLVQLALDQGETQAALDYLNEGEKNDCENNEGRRRNDYELRRGQILSKSGNIDEAQRVFDSLVQRDPAELRFAGSAAEAMLSAKQAAKAKKYAEQGLAGARKQNNRDSEQYFQELLSAAQKQSG